MMPTRFHTRAASEDGKPHWGALPHKRFHTGDRKMDLARSFCLVHLPILLIPIQDKQVIQQLEAAWVGFSAIFNIKVC